jgi:hypothetical protein
MPSRCYLIPNKRKKKKKTSQTPDIVLALSSEDYIHITRGFSDTVMVGTIQLTPSYMHLARLCREVNNSIHLFPRMDKNN